MGEWRVRSGSEQFFEFLREELFGGRWSGTMPGVHRLAAEFQVNRKTVEGALQMLEGEGLLIGQGAGKRRMIDLSARPARPGFRVAFLLYEPSDNHSSYILELKHQLREAGHVVSIAARTLVELKIDLERVAHVVRKHEADAWVVVAGSREILEWFHQQNLAAFALFGRQGNVPIASAAPNRQPAIQAAVRRLVALGHRRIVFLGRSLLRLPNPGFDGRAFLQELEVQGIATGPYNLPNWEDSAEGIKHCLDSLFTSTPPTALLIDEAFLFMAVQQHLAQKGILAPGQVSMICTEYDKIFDWCRPMISHFRWDTKPVVRRVVRWAKQMSLGHQDRVKLLTTVEFVEGGSIGEIERVPQGR
jgi:DNA-binding LacI/PurR family transcriptional regulator